MCVNYITKKKTQKQVFFLTSHTPIVSPTHTHTHTHMQVTWGREWSERASEWVSEWLRQADEWAKGKSDIWIAFLLFICYTSVTPTLKGASHSLPESFSVCVHLYTCECASVCVICNYSTLTLTAKLNRVCRFILYIHMYVNKYIYIYLYMYMCACVGGQAYKLWLLRCYCCSMPLYYVTNTCATHSWVPAATSHSTHTCACK